MKIFQVLIILVISIQFIYTEEANNKFLYNENDFHPTNENFIKKINSAQNQWEAGSHKRFANMDMKKIKQLNSAILSKELLANYVILENPPVDPNIPKEFDARLAWPNCESIKEIQDQADCGSCWAISTASVMSDRICIHSNQTLQTRISPEQIAFCCEDCGNACNGGFPPKVFDYWVTNGIVTGSLYESSYDGCIDYSIPPCQHHEPGPFPWCGNGDMPTRTCPKKCKDGYSKNFEDDKQYGEKAYSIISNEKAIQTEIMTNGPVVTGVTLKCDFLTYKTGVYFPIIEEACGGHAIKIIGWGEENGIPYWLIVNSWNEYWGEKGTVKFIRGQNIGGIEDYVSTGLPKIKNNVVVNK